MPEPTTAAFATRGSRRRSRAPQNCRCSTRLAALVWGRAGVVPHPAPNASGGRYLTQALFWGMDERLSAPHATLVNGTTVQGFELDDVHRQGVLHVGAVTLPALFAAVETTAGSFIGRDLLRAVVARYVVAPPGSRLRTRTTGIRKNVAVRRTALLLRAGPSHMPPREGACRSSL